MEKQPYTKENLRRFIETTLKNSKGDTAPLYKFWETMPNVIGGYFPSKEAYKSYVRKVRARMRSNPQQLDTPDLVGLDKTVFSEKEDSTEIEVSSSDRIKQLDQLLEECKVDPEVWHIDSHEVRKWEQASKDEFGEITITPLFLVKARLVPIKPRIPTLQPIILPDPHRRASGPSVPTKRTLVVGDAQIGFNRQGEGVWETYHDRRAMEAILAILKDHTFDEIIINGDMIDATEASRYTQKPEFVGTLQPAINELGLYLQQIRSLAPTSKMVFLQGNHEVRLANSMIDNLRYAYGLTAFKQNVPVMSLRNLLALDSIDVEFIEDYPKGSYWIGDNLRILHGEYTSVAKELNTSHTNALFGHLHRIETQSKTTFFKHGPKQVSVHTHGCLCKIDGTVPGVNTRPNWQQGFVVVYHSDDYIGVNHIQIDDGVCLFDGKKYIGYDMNVGGLI